MRGYKDIYGKYRLKGCMWKRKTQILAHGSVCLDQCLNSMNLNFSCASTWKTSWSDIYIYRHLPFILSFKETAFSQLLMCIDQSVSVCEAIESGISGKLVEINECLQYVPIMFFVLFSLDWTAFALSFFKCYDVHVYILLIKSM